MSLNNVHKSAFIIAFFVSCFMVNVVHAQRMTFQLDTSAENIPKKALIVKHDAKLFEAPYGGRAEEAPFIHLYFLMKPTVNNRVPVLKKFSKRRGIQPEGWLEKDAYVEWNTVQMINFEPQKGRERVKIHATHDCATKFSRLGKLVEGCEMLGEEPRQHQRSRLFIQVFQHQRGNYHGGFIRVYPKEPSSKPHPRNPQLGYDLVFVVDSTLSMYLYFQPTMRVLKSFIKIVRSSMQGEVATPLQVGLLLFRDRQDKHSTCNIEYLTRWKQHLTPDIEAVIQALGKAQVLGCSTPKAPEAVFDGLYRAMADTKWNDKHFKTIILIGDAPPNLEVNPMNLSVPSNLRLRRLTLGNRVITIDSMMH